MNQTATAPAPGLAALWRLARIVIGYGIVYGVNALVKEIGGLGLPAIALPLVSALLNAISKWIRDKWGIDVKVV